MKDKTLSFKDTLIEKITYDNRTYQINTDIDYVNHYLSIPKFNNKPLLAHHLEYNYFQFVSKTGDRLVISCLYLSENNLPDHLKIIRKKKLFVIPTKDKIR